MYYPGHVEVYNEERSHLTAVKREDAYFFLIFMDIFFIAFLAFIDLRRNYLSGYDNKTALTALSGQNEIDSLLFTNNEDSSKTEYWQGADAENKISFSFFNTTILLLDENAYVGGGGSGVYNNGFHEFSDVQKDAVRTALLEFEKVINVEFVEVAEENDQVGTIRFGISQDEMADNTVAFAWVVDDYWSTGGDVWLDTNHNGVDLGKGTYEFFDLNP